MEVWTRTKVTAICVTHDVDEAILLADRVVMMTNGPDATHRQDHGGRPAAPAHPQGAARAPRLLRTTARSCSTSSRNTNHALTIEATAVPRDEHRRLVVDRRRHGLGPDAGAPVRRRRPAPSTSRCSTPSRAATTTASCCRRCCRARRPTTRSSPMTTPGTPRNGIDAPLGRARSTQIDRDAQGRRLDQGGEAPYDKLVIATGSAPFIIPVPGKDLPGVVHLPRPRRHQRDDRGRASRGAKAVVIGGGLLGLEAAAGLQRAGHGGHGHPPDGPPDGAPAGPRRRLSAAEGRWRRAASSIHCKGATKAILGKDRVEAVLLDDGTVYAADHRRAWRWASAPKRGSPMTRISRSGAASSSTTQMHTSDPAILRSANAWSMTGSCSALSPRSTIRPRSLAAHAAGRRTPPSRPVQTATKLKVTGVDLFRAGDFAEGAGARGHRVPRSRRAASTSGWSSKDDRLIGAVMYGDTADGAWFFDLIKDGTDISPMRDTLIFGPAFQGGAPLDPMAAVAALPPEAEICGCNGVCKGKIVDGHRRRGRPRWTRCARRPRPVRLLRHLHRAGRTGAGADPGRRLHPATPVQPMCKCTDHTP